MRIKDKNLIKLIGVGAICIALSVGSYALGVHNAKSKVVTVTKDKDGSVKVATENRNTVDTVAIVNADIGITVNGELVNYATRLVPSLKENFVVTNLEAARSGVEKGAYAAYIVIPSNFSQNSVSLNNTPTATELEYSINQNLDENSRINAIYDIVDFEKTLNQSMSYMYLSSIMNEFHAVQDGSATIVSNDERDKETLLSIQPYDLTSLVTMPELVKTDNFVSPLDVSVYNNKSQEDINDISSSYEYYISLGKSDIELMQARGNDLSGRFAQMQEYLKQMNITTDDAGNIVYETGVSNLKSSIKNYNTTVLDNKETEIVNSFGDAKEYLEDAKRNLVALMKADSETLDLNKWNAAAQISTSISGGTAPVITFDGTNLMINETSVALTYTGIDVTQMNDILAKLGDYIVTMEGMISTSSDANLQSNYTNYLTGNSELENVITAAKNQTIKCGSVDQVALAGNLQAAVDSTAAGSIPDKNAIKAILDRYIVEFSDTLESGDTLRKVLQSNSDAIQTAVDTKSSISRMDTEELSKQVDLEIVAPLVNQADSSKNNLIAKYDDEKTALSEYQTAVGNYDPLSKIDNAVIQGYFSDLMTNNQQIQTTVTQNYQDNMQFVSDVYKNTELNTTTLGQSILDANKASNQAVTDSLAKAQKEKEKTSDTNQVLLADFITKLPYTRIGELEYTKAYNFIISPTFLSDVSEKNQIQSTYTAAEKTKAKDETVKTPIVTTVLYIILGFLLLFVIVIVIARAVKKKNETNQIS